MDKESVIVDAVLEKNSQMESLEEDINVLIEQYEELYPNGGYLEMLRTYKTSKF